MPAQKDLKIINKHVDSKVIKQQLDHVYKNNIKGVMYYQGTPVKDLTKYQLEALIWILLEDD